jgi:dipeptidyl aminopeptidase/acylaminoacyl peptidase
VAILSTTADLVIYPTGAGAPRRIEHGPIERFSSAYWFPDGKSLMVVANEPARPARCYRQAIEGGKPEPLTPEGIAGTLSPRGDLILALDGLHWRLYPLDGSAVRDLPGIGAREEPVSWSPEGEAVYVHQSAEIPAVLKRVDLATGTRSAGPTVGPPNQAGLVRIGTMEPTFDPQRGYGYSYNRRLSKLFVIEAAP